MPLRFFQGGGNINKLVTFILMKSLKDQLLKAGLTDKQSLKNAHKQGKKGLTKPKNQRGQASESAKQAEQARIEKTNRDKELNRKRQLAIEKKARHSQIGQLVQSSKIDREGGELAYNFTHALDGQSAKIRKLYVTEEQQKQLSKNQIAIVALGSDQFELVPTIVAKKIAVQDPQYIIDNKSADLEPLADDPYADFQIPDDLVW